MRCPCYYPFSRDFFCVLLKLGFEIKVQLLGVQTIGVQILGGILKKFINIYGKKTRGPQTRQNKGNKTEQIKQDRTNKTRQVYSLFQDLWNESLDFF